MNGEVAGSLTVADDRVDAVAVEIAQGGWEQIPKATYGHMVKEKGVGDGWIVDRVAEDIENMGTRRSR